MSAASAPFGVGGAARQSEHVPFASVAAREIPARTCAFYAIGMRSRRRPSARRPSAKNRRTSRSPRCMTERKRRQACRSTSRLESRATRCHRSHRVESRCASAARARVVACRRIVRGLLDPLRRRRRDARRRRVVGIRRSAGRELESRRAAARDSRVARGTASRASAAHRSRRRWQSEMRACVASRIRTHPSRIELPIEDNHDCASRRPTDIACPLARSRSRSPS